MFPVATPSQKVVFLLGDDEDTDPDHKAHQLFTEMEELMADDAGNMVWKETAR